MIKIRNPDGANESNNNNDNYATRSRRNVPIF